MGFSSYVPAADENEIVDEEKLSPLLQSLLLTFFTDGGQVSETGTGDDVAGTNLPTQGTFSVPSTKTIYISSTQLAGANVDVLASEIAHESGHMDLNSQAQIVNAANVDAAIALGEANEAQAFTAEYVVEKQLISNGQNSRIFQQTIPSQRKRMAKAPLTLAGDLSVPSFGNLFGDAGQPG